MGFRTKNHCTGMDKQRFSSQSVIKVNMTTEADSSRESVTDSRRSSPHYFNALRSRTKCCEMHSSLRGRGGTSTVGRCYKGVTENTLGLCAIVACGM
jgi:hypothetical protein